MRHQPSWPQMFALMVGVPTALYGVGAEHLAFSCIGLLALSVSHWKVRGSSPFHVTTWLGVAVCVGVWFDVGGVLFGFGMIVAVACVTVAMLVGVRTIERGLKPKIFALSIA